MYAIVDFLGKQIKVEKDEIIKIPHMDGQVGEKIESDKVLLFHHEKGTKIGTPYVDSAKVLATIYAQDRNKKTVAGVYKRRKQYKKSWGFREQFTLIKITDLQVSV